MSSSRSWRTAGSLHARWAAGEPALGMLCALPDSVATEIVAQAGVDWVCVDMQHGLMGWQDALHMLQAISTTAATPVVRAASNDAALIGRCLDAGAEAVIVPLVNSAAEAVHAVRACRYAPDGVRSFGPLRSVYSVGPDSYADVTCIVMVETEQAVAAVDDIVAVRGVDAVFVGPSDLSISLGLPPAVDQDDPRFAAALARVVAACRGHGIPAGIYTTPELAGRRIDEGFGFVALGNDMTLLAAAARSAVATVRRARPPAS